MSVNIHIRRIVQTVCLAPIHLKKHYEDVEDGGVEEDCYDDDDDADVTQNPHVNVQSSIIRSGTKRTHVPGQLNLLAGLGCDRKGRHSLWCQALELHR